MPLNEPDRDKNWLARNLRWVVMLLGAIGILLAARMAVGAEETPAPKQGSTPVLFLGIGASSSDVSVRKIGFGLPAAGWYNSGIDKNLDSWADEFKRRDLPFRVMLHNPWGTENGEVMDFDQRIEARENAKLRLVCDSFGPWLESRLRPHVGERGECIIYLGSGRRDKDLLDLKDQPAAYLERLTASVAEVPDWCTLAFDDTGKSEIGDPFSDFVHLQSRLRRVYVEPRPIVGGAMPGLPVISDANLWRRTNPDIYPDARHMIPDRDCGDEILRLMVSGNEATRRRVLQRVVDDGHTVLFAYPDISWALDLLPGE